MGVAIKGNTADRPPVIWDFAPFLLIATGIFFWVGFVAMGTFRPLTHEIVGVDPVGYYAWPRSLIFNGDLDFENEYRTLNRGLILPGDSLVNPDAPRTAIDRVPNAFSIGPGMLWTPFILGGDIVAHLGDWEADGYTQPYFTAVAYADMVYAWIGMLLLYAFLRHWFDRRIACLATFTAFSCTTILYYAYSQQSVSHATSFFSVCLLLYVWARFRERRTLWMWAIIGACVGLSALVRWQNAAFAVIIAVDLLWADRKRNLPCLIAAAAGAVIAFVPQMAAWHAVYGSYLTIPQGSGFMDWTRPNPVRMLFSLEHGLITWTPLAALGAVGLCWLPKEYRRVFAGLLAALLIQLFIQSIAGNVGWSYGMRRLTNCVPLFAVGFALLMVRFPWSTRRLLAVILPFAIWNAVSVLQYGGFLDAMYVNRAIAELVDDYGLEQSELPALTELPNGEPFDLAAFIEEHRFPQDRAPTFEQMVPDKLWVIQGIGERLLLMGASED